MKKKINIGLDIGTTSVGWSIIDEEYNLIDTGVRLFPDPAATGELENLVRRKARSSRRRIRRTKTRKEALLNWFVEKGLASDIDDAKDKINYDISELGFDNPIQLKVHALNSIVTNEQLVAILFHYIHHRGYFYITEDDENFDSKLSEMDNRKFPSELILSFYKENGYYKGSDISMNISNRMYVEEIKAILKKQNKSEDFINSYLEIFKRVRDYSQGPGGPKSPSKYGLYRMKNGKIEKIGNSLWEENVGRCTYYKNEYRGGKYSPIAELFNLLNDLSNIYYQSEEKEYINKEQKKTIFSFINDYIFEKKKVKNISLKDISKLCNFNDIENIKGYRIDKNSKPEITKLENYLKIAIFMIEKDLLKDKYIFSLESIELINNVFEILQKHQDVLSKSIAIKNKYNTLPEKDCISLASIIKKTSQTHSLSYKAMFEYIQYSFENFGNQMVYFSNVNISNDEPSKFKNKKYIPSGLLDNEIISPTTRRAYNQSINVVNKIIKKYSKDFDINNITIEMARDSNSKIEKENINKAQKNNKIEMDSILNENNIKNENINSITRMKLKLWKEQDYIDLYDGSRIELSDVLKPGTLEIDHIIPYSISSIDARYNKVLTKKILNKEKGNLTPYQWLSKKGKYEEFKIRCKEKIKSSSKLDKLLYEDDLLLNMNGFVERNIVDTRYASRCVLNVMQSFFKENKDKYQDVKIKVINGSITNYSRYNLFIDSGKPIFPKNRERYEHHAIDACIVNYLGMNSTLNKLVKYNKMYSDIKLRRQSDNSINLFNPETGEVIEMNSLYSIDNNLLKISNAMKTFVEDNMIKFSRMSISKKNIKLSNETIYSFVMSKDNNSGYIRESIDLTSNNDLEKLKLLFLDNWDDLSEKEKQKKQESIEKLFSYKRNKKMYDELKVIFNEFYKLNPKINPFVAYMNELGFDNPKFIKLDDKRITRKIWLLGDNKDKTNLIILNKNKKDDSKKFSVMMTLGIMSIYIFRDNQNKLRTIPINQKVLNFKNGEMIVDEQKLRDVLEFNKISFDKYKNKNFFVIKKDGTVFISKKDNLLFYSNGGGNMNANKIEIKPLFCTPEKQKQVAISTIANEYDICEIDELGKIYNRKNLNDIL